MFENDIQQGQAYYFGIENPHGLLERRPYMQDEQWPESCNIRYIRFDSCAFDHPEQIMKPMSYWTNSPTYNATGVTTDGRCRRQCKMGEETPSGGYIHPKRVRELKCPRKKNALAPMWVDAILQDAIDHRDREEQNVVIDLFAGWQSLQPICKEKGLGYIALDIMGLRE
jgi:hypothetical protein